MFIPQLNHVIKHVPVDYNDYYRLAREDILDIDELANVGHRWADLNEWPHSRTSRPVESYITAVDRLRRFWDGLADREDEGEEGIERGLWFYRFEIIFFGWHCVSSNPVRSAEAPVNGTEEIYRGAV